LSVVRPRAFLPGGAKLIPGGRENRLKANGPARRAPGGPASEARIFLPNGDELQSIFPSGAEVKKKSGAFEGPPVCAFYGLRVILSSGPSSSSSFQGLGFISVPGGPISLRLAVATRLMSISGAPCDPLTTNVPGDCHFDVVFGMLSHPDWCGIIACSPQVELDPTSTAPRLRGRHARTHAARE